MLAAPFGSMSSSPAETGGYRSTQQPRRIAARVNLLSAGKTCGGKDEHANEITLFRRVKWRASQLAGFSADSRAVEDRAGLGDDGRWVEHLDRQPAVRALDRFAD